MKKKILSFLLVLSLLVTLIVPFATTTASAATGTAITNQSGLAGMSTTGTYYLANDITISGTWTGPSLFAGEFDGQGHTITFANGAVINGGLFKSLYIKAYVHDFYVVQAGSATWNYNSADTGSCTGNIGGVAAYATANANYANASYTNNAANKIRFENIVVTATITASTVATNDKGQGQEAAGIGGIVGEMNTYTEITNCVFNGSITDTYDHSKTCDHGDATELSSYGGIAGIAFRSGTLIITECINNANITGKGNQGGILGAASPVWNNGAVFNTTIQRCVNNGTITSNGTGTGSGGKNGTTVGGIAGWVYAGEGKTATIQNNINRGSIAKSSDAKVFAAGIVGRLRRSSSSVNFNFLGNLQLSSVIAGNQIITQQDGGGTVVFTNNYAPTNPGTGTQYVQISSLTFSTLNSAYPNVFALYGATGGTNIGLRCEHGASNGVASTANIATEGDLFAALSAGSGTYTLTKDITIHKFWNNNVIFKGTLNGNDHTIKFANGTVIYGGLFEFMSIGATVKNLNIVQEGNATWRTVAKSTTGYYASTGSIGAVSATIFGQDGAGLTEAKKITIQNVNVTANITVTESVNSSKETVAGGLVGYLRYAYANFENCKFNGSLNVSMTPSSNSAFGGIVGMIAQRTYKAQFVECINEANISAPCNVGGIVGWSRIWSSNNANTGIDYLRIQYCMNRGNITCTGAYSGGEGYKDVGGIIGYAHGVDSSTTLILNNINYGNVSFTGSATAYPGGICGRVRYGTGTMEFSGNINYGTVSVGSGSTAPILNWNENKWRLDGVEKDDADIVHLNNYATAGRSTTSGTFSDNEGQMTCDLIKGSSYTAYGELVKAYPDVYTMTRNGRVSLTWEKGDLSYQSADCYSIQMSLSLDGTIQMRMGVAASCVVPSDKGVTLTAEVDNVKIVNASPIYDTRDASSGYFVASKALTAKEMADNHTYKITIKEGSEEITSATFTTSVKAYANAILGEENYSEWHDLMTAMLNYGAAAQTYFNYNTSNPAGSTSISFSESGLPSVSKVSGDATFIDHVSGSMNLNSGTDMNLYVKPVNAGDSLTASVKDSGNVTVSGVTCTKVTSGSLNGFWLIKIPNLSADRLAETFNVTVSNGSKSVTFSYSALCWVNEVLNTEDTSHVTNNMKLLARGVGAYAIAAQATASYEQPILFASQNVSPYVVSYSAGASDYLKSTALSVTRDMNRDGVTLSASTAAPAGQKVVELKTDSSVSNYKIEFENDGDIIITGNTDRWTALGALEFFNVLLKSNSSGDYFISNPQTYTPSNATNYTRDGWLLATPAFAAGTLSSGMYDDGTGLGADKNAPDAERSYMMSISGTTAVQFNTYKSRLTSCGYTVVASNTNSSNQFYQYKKGNQLLYCYYINSTKVVRVIEDRASTPETEFEYSFSNSSSTATDLIMYGLYYTADGYTVNNGAFNIIKQADGSVILIDGGKAEQATDAAIAGLWTYLHTLTGASYSQKITISCWFITHPHGDHYALVSALIDRYHDYLDLQRVMFNFPNAAVVGTGVYAKIRDAAHQYFPDAMVLKCHTGQKITLGSLTMDILTAQEDLVNASTGTTGTLSDGNLLTTVCRFTFADGTKYMELGDFDEDRQSALIKMYNATEFACKVTSVAHHGYNDVSSVYAKIKASYAFFPNYTNTNFDTSVDGGSWRKGKITSSVNSLKSANSSVKIDYAGLNTVKLTCQGGNITRTTSSVVK